MRGAARTSSEQKQSDAHTYLLQMRRGEQEDRSLGAGVARWTGGGDEWERRFVLPQIRSERPRFARCRRLGPTLADGEGRAQGVLRPRDGGFTIWGWGPRAMEQLREMRNERFLKVSRERVCVVCGTRRCAVFKARLLLATTRTT